MRLFHWFFFVLLLSLSACQTQPPVPLKIIANAWIGYSPLFYLKETGLLAKHNIELSVVTSLGESQSIYETAKLDAFTGTQYEFAQSLQLDHTLIPIIMFNRSNGGDAVLSNLSLEELKNAPKIDVYLEINSVNMVVFKDFVKQHRLETLSFNFINSEQNKTVLHIKDIQQPSLIVTYAPYTQTFSQAGFTTLATTKNGLNLLVVDALFTNKAKLAAHSHQFNELNRLIGDALGQLKRDPLDYYNTVKPYLNPLTYAEFTQSLSDIEFLQAPLSPDLIERLNQAEFPIRNLL